MPWAPSLVGPPGEAIEELYLRSLPSLCRPSQRGDVFAIINRPDYYAQGGSRILSRMRRTSSFTIKPLPPRPGSLLHAEFGERRSANFGPFRYRYLAFLSSFRNPFGLVSEVPNSAGYSLW